VTTRTLLAAALALCAAALVGAQTAEPTPAPTVKPKSAAAARAPLDFSGIWEIDLARSKGISKNMEKAVISVRQSGDRIWLEPIEQKGPWLAADQIVVDGKLYEKALGAGRKGSVQAEWGNDKKSLWMQSTTGTDENPNAATQRSVWRLQDHGKVWTRQTWTVQTGETRESFLVFKKRAAKKKP
jgi:hypothetical protein